jgi:hypothetical protein
MKFKGEGAVRLKLPLFSEPPADSSISVTGDAARAAGTVLSSRAILAGLIGLLGLRNPRLSASTRTPSPLWASNDDMQQAVMTTAVFDLWDGLALSAGAFWDCQ